MGGVCTRGTIKHTKHTTSPDFQQRIDSNTSTPSSGFSKKLKLIKSFGGKKHKRRKDSEGSDDDVDSSSFGSNAVKKKTRHIFDYGELHFSISRELNSSSTPIRNQATKIQNLECEIQEKTRQMRLLEHSIIESSEFSIANASLADMQQTLMRLMTQCNEKGFELEIKSAYNRILQEQLQNKLIECASEQLSSSCYLSTHS